MQMNLDSKGTWSEETQRCLQELNLVLSAYSDSYKSLGVPGCDSVAGVYSGIAHKIAEINRGGPSALQDEIYKATAIASTIYRAMRE